MKKKILISFLAVAGVLLVWGTWAAVRAHGKLVTLNVRNADVREVVRKIEWQTWENIFVEKGVAGKITLNVHKVPLEEVLRLIDEQASCRWTAVYPLYSSGKSLTAFKKSLRGEINPVGNGWTNLAARPFSGASGGFGNNLRSQNIPISLQFSNQDLDVVSLALARYAQARIVPEDGVTRAIQLNLNSATMPEAVAQVARKIHRKWTHYYFLQSRVSGRGELVSEPTPEMLDAAQQRYESVLTTMTPEERQKAEAARKRREEFQKMTPEKRQQAMTQRASDPQFQQQMQNRMLASLLNSTPEQRVERSQRMAQRRSQRGS